MNTRLIKRYMEIRYQNNPYSLCERLAQRFMEECPHEIGIFLGYPLKDVQDYIKYAGQKYLLNGYWKVYHDPIRALQTFQNYDLAKIKIYDRKWRLEFIFLKRKTIKIFSLSSQNFLPDP